MRTRQLIAFLCLVAVGGTLLAWLKSVSRDSQLVYTTALLSRADSVPPISVVGTVMGTLQYPLYWPIDGTVTAVRARPGMKVRKGEVLAMLDIDRREVKLFELLASLRGELEPGQTFRGYRRALRATRRASPLERAGVETEVLRSVREFLEYESLFSQMKLRTLDKILRSPVNGIVGDTTISVGARIDAKRQENPALTIIAQSEDAKGDYFYRLEVPEESIGAIQVGQQVDVQLPFSGSEPHKAKVIEVSRVAFLAEKRRYFVVRAEPLEASTNVDQLRYGMRILADVQIKSTSEGVWVPRAALDISIPDHMVRESVIYSSEPQLSSSRLPGKEVVGHRDAESLPGSVLRSLANVGAPQEVRRADIYLLTANEQVIRASVIVEHGNQHSVLALAPSLAGARVITHLRNRDAGLGTLFSN